MAGGDADQYVNLLLPCKISVVSFDFSGAGNSGGNLCTLGFREVRRREGVFLRECSDRPLCFASIFMSVCGISACHTRLCLFLTPFDPIFSTNASFYSSPLAYMNSLHINNDPPPYINMSMCSLPLHRTSLPYANNSFPLLDFGPFL